jgi:2-C-methyl-D-erythritol 2,4-cyclodiphosphate synthase
MIPFRLGIGHDVHRLFPGRSLVLGGVTVSTDVGFGTHTDGDVLCHALIDALAGAIADGDLGTHYPEDDPETEDARSLEFVEEFAGYVRRAGYEIANVDAFVVLGTVRLRPHIDAMRRNLSDALAIDIANVSVKARSNDGYRPGRRGPGVCRLGERSGLSSHRLSPSPHPLERTKNVGRNPVVATKSEMKYRRLGRRVTPEVCVREHVVVEAQDGAAKRRASDADGVAVEIPDGHRIIDRDLATACHAIPGTFLLSSQSHRVALGIPKADPYHDARVETLEHAISKPRDRIPQPHPRVDEDVDLPGAGIKHRADRRRRQLITRGVDANHL